MDATDNVNLDLLIAKLIRFFNGGITYDNFKQMSKPRIYQLAEFSVKISREEAEQIKG